MRIATKILVACAVAGSAIVPPKSLWSQFAEPVRIVAADLPHAAPAIADINGDGVRDLVVGVFQDDPYTLARLRWFENVGTNKAPKFDQARWLQADGRDARVDEFCHTGFGPQFVDFDGDGIKDLVSGSRDGKIHVFRARPGGGFRQSVAISYVADDALLRSFRYNCRVFLNDWDQDGQLDVFAVTRKNIWWIRGSSATDQIRFETPVSVLEIQRGEQGFSCCSVADWDSDGKPDLIVARWDGSIQWYRNRSRLPREPVFGAPERLMEPGLSAIVPRLEDGRIQIPNRPAGHIRICVVDFDVDGQLDILVGDAWRSPNVELGETAAQLARLNTARNEQRRLAAQIKDMEDTKDFAKDSNDVTIQNQLDRLRAQCGIAWRTAYGSNSLKLRHGAVWLFRSIGDQGE